MLKYIKLFEDFIKEDFKYTEKYHKVPADYRMQYNEPSVIDATAEIAILLQCRPVDMLSFSSNDSDEWEYVEILNKFLTINADESNQVDDNLIEYVFNAVKFYYYIDEDTDSTMIYVKKEDFDKIRHLIN